MSPKFKTQPGLSGLFFSLENERKSHGLDETINRQFVGCLWDKRQTPHEAGLKSLKRLASPTGLEPVFPP